jgi:hypothetical protein
MARILPALQSIRDLLLRRVRLSDRGKGLAGARSLQRACPLITASTNGKGLRVRLVDSTCRTTR